ncbi:hypothetical protein CBM2589_A90510 [Cupriavidus taiwanensis]|uniref:Uncharacterized protein n=1 Tax=Cupriavidus taiwanensis TaxID=164546 RepID=A0A375CG55_9BURK|nr:hypothetical protein CBM2589_A90510 [Cupriavidus taiwanensis]
MNVGRGAGKPLASEHGLSAVRRVARTPWILASDFVDAPALSPAPLRKRERGENQWPAQAKHDKRPASLRATHP